VHLPSNSPTTRKRRSVHAGSPAKLVIPCARSGASAPRHFWGGGDAASSLPPIDETAVQRFSSCHPGKEHVEAQALGPTCLLIL